MQIEQKQNRIFRPQSNTTLSAEESNQVTTELENVIRAGNLTPNAGTLTQVRDAIQNVVDTAANELQEQIDAITSASDVFDVVGTYAQLQAYDTSTVPVNDIIKVLQDETRDNAMTYYRWNGTSWVFIGSEGPYYTVAEVDQTFATKAQLPGIATTQQVGLIKPDGQTTIVQQDGTLSISSNVAASLPLFTPIWADHLLNNASYLRSDTFSWQSGVVYISAYQHLVDDVNGITSETETVAGTTITFYRATDGHKIVLADQESNVGAIYTATGVAWYYILDTANQRFKIPRSKHQRYGNSPVIGNGMTLGLTNGTIYGAFRGTTGAGTTIDNSLYGAPVGTSGTSVAQISQTGVGVTEDPAKSGMVSTAVEDIEQYKYLYFYVGNTVQDQTTIDVGQITEALNGKADAGMANLTAAGKELVSGLAMPSSQYVDLTLGASGNTYTAPANGYYLVRFVGLNPAGYVYGHNLTSEYELESRSTLNGTAVGVVIPALKNESVQFYYDAGGTITFRFIYAEGAQ